MLGGTASISKRVAEKSVALPSPFLPSFLPSPLLAGVLLGPGFVPFSDRRPPHGKALSVLRPLNPRVRLEDAGAAADAGGPQNFLL